MSDVDPSRRRLLRATGTLPAVAVAGCTGPEDADSVGTEAPADGTNSNGADGREDGADSNVGDGSNADGTGDLDLREANVVDVSVEPADTAETYRFDVTLHHDDGGEDGYANWWQVERLDGDRLGRRELAHSHSQQPFTRSATIEVPEPVSCVVVRGHDETHGYGGRAMVVAVESDETRVVDQSTDPQSIAAGDCP